MTSTSAILGNTLPAIRQPPPEAEPEDEQLPPFDLMVRELLAREAAAKALWTDFALAARKLTEMRKGRKERIAIIFALAAKAVLTEESRLVAVVHHSSWSAWLGIDREVIADAIEDLAEFGLITIIRAGQGTPSTVELSLAPQMWVRIGETAIKMIDSKLARLARRMSNNMK
jgi:hypothetical protein